MAKELCKIVAVEHLTLDGVYESPARLENGIHGTQKYGGWAVAGDDPKMQEVISTYMMQGWSLLAGRITFEELYESWHVKQPESAMAKALTTVQKFVTTYDPNYVVQWENSVLLAGDAIATITKLKQEYDKPLIIFGSGMLVRSLLQYNLVDEFLLMIHPLVLGEGKRLFTNDERFTFTLSKSIPTDTGVIIATYQMN